MKRVAKFDEIVSCLSRELYADASISEVVRERLIEEAEALTDKWADEEAKQPAT